MRCYIQHSQTLAGWLAAAWSTVSRCACVCVYRGFGRWRAPLDRPAAYPQWLASQHRATADSHDSNLLYNRLYWTQCSRFCVVWLTRIRLIYMLFFYTHAPSNRDSEKCPTRGKQLVVSNVYICFACMQCLLSFECCMLSKCICMCVYVCELGMCITCAIIDRVVISNLAIWAKNCIYFVFSSSSSVASSRLASCIA